MYTDYSSLTPSVLVRSPDRSYRLGTLGQVPAEAGKAQMLPQRRTTLSGHHTNESPEGTTRRVGNRFIVSDGQVARDDTAALPIVRAHQGSCNHSHPRLWHPIMAMNSGHRQRNRAHDVQSPLQERTSGTHLWRSSRKLGTRWGGAIPDRRCG
jgi:hypothetical protein